MYMRSSIKLTADFSSETIESTKQWDDTHIFKGLGSGNSPETLENSGIYT